jgi:hypothetical protein
MASWKEQWNKDSSSDHDTLGPTLSEDSLGVQSMMTSSSSDLGYIEFMEGTKESSETDSELMYPEPEEEHSENHDVDEMEEEEGDDDDDGDEEKPIVSGKKRPCQGDGTEEASKKDYTSIFWQKTHES